MSMIKKSHSLAMARHGNKSTIFPLRTAEGTVIDHMPAQLLVSGHDAFHPDVIVQTTSSELNHMLQTTSKEEAKLLFPLVWSAIKNVEPSILHGRGGKAWSNFCSDIILYYVCRYQLFGTLIPTVDT
jgi:hypothetical protein